MILAAARFVVSSAAPSAQQGGAPAQPSAAPVPAVTSPEALSDGRVAFRVLAPRADEVRLVGTDIPRNIQGTPMTKDANGVWEVVVGPLLPGSYRYNFNVNGVSVIDPRSPAISESNNNVWSLVHVPGADFMDTKDVPHGSVAAITYYSRSLQKFRRMHVYTPPGYDLGDAKFPVFYLLHGAGDSDESWTSVGRAGFILDNLIAAKKAVPMIVVMPAGHTSRTPLGRGAPTPAAATDGRGLSTQMEEFVHDFVHDVMPYAEKHYRVIADRQHRAIAGLSMGGNQTLNIAIPHLDQFTYVGVFSSGLIGALGRGAAAPPSPALDSAWEQEHSAALENASTKKGLKLFWFATGSEDRLMPTTKSTIEMFKKHGFTPTLTESGGGHTWANWRDYLNTFAQQLFH
ncbi:MAG TPA: alpha/beta hydrolase-fold protein [Vicinamibacterales bacterium]